jgi:hypothetical protein
MYVLDEWKVSPMTRNSREVILITPWLAPFGLGVLYIAELAWEVGISDPGRLAMQVLFATPLVITLSVLLSALEQQLRTHELGPRLRGWVLWTPRILLLLFVGFLAMLSLDVFVEGRSAGGIALGLLMHNLPALALLGGVVLAWRWPWTGAIVLLAFVLWWAPTFGRSGFPPSVFLLMAVLPISVAALFLLSWTTARPSRGLRSRAAVTAADTVRG